MRRWLDAYPSAEAARAIAAEPALLEEARALLPRLEAEVAPAGEEGVRRALLPLMAIYPQPERAGAEWAMWWSHYIEDLSGFCEASLAEAVRAYRRAPTSRFMPLPGELRALAQVQTVPAIGRLWRVRQALAARPAPGPAPSTTRSSAGGPPPPRTSSRGEDLKEGASADPRSSPGLGAAEPGGGGPPPPGGGGGGPSHAPASRRGPAQ